MALLALDGHDLTWQAQRGEEEGKRENSLHPMNSTRSGLGEGNESLPDWCLIDQALAGEGRLRRTNERKTRFQAEDVSVLRSSKTNGAGKSCFARVTGKLARDKSGTRFAGTVEVRAEGDVREEDGAEDMSRVSVSAYVQDQISIKTYSINPARVNDQ